MEEVTIKAGTVMRYNGIPFELKEDTVFLGLQSNLRFAEENAPTENPPA